MPNVWSMCAVCAMFIVQFNLPVGCWPLMVGAHNLRLILQIEMQTDATGVVDSRYTYMGMSCATPDKILHSMQDNTKQLFQLPYGQHPFHCLTLLYCTVTADAPSKQSDLRHDCREWYDDSCWHYDTWELLWVTLVYDRTLLSLGWSVSGSWLCRVTVILWHETFLLLPPCITYII